MQASIEISGTESIGVCSLSFWSRQENGFRLARNVDILILDHHLMRDHQGACMA